MQQSDIICTFNRTYPLLSGFIYAYRATYPEMNGTITISGKVYQMSINAGSYFYLENNDTSYIFGDEQKRFRKLFVTGADEENDDN